MLLKDFFIETYSFEQIQAMTQKGGCSQGFPGISTYAETFSLYERYESDFQKILDEKVEKYNTGSVMGLFGLMGNEHIDCPFEFANACVWLSFEIMAHDIMKILSTHQEAFACKLQ